MKTLDKVLHRVTGSQIGRKNVGERPKPIVSSRQNKIVKRNQIKVFDCKVILKDGYDQGRVYWGNKGGELRVSYTTDLSYVEFYRKAAKKD